MKKGQITNQAKCPKQENMKMNETPNDTLLFLQVQQELVRYLDIRLEQLELLLYRLDRIARQASKDATEAQERQKLQEEVVKIQNDIDRIAARIASIQQTAEQGS